MSTAPPPIPVNLIEHAAECAAMNAEILAQSVASFFPGVREVAVRGDFDTRSFAVWLDGREAVRCGIGDDAGPVEVVDALAWWCMVLAQHPGVPE